MKRFSLSLLAIIILQFAIVQSCSTEEESVAPVVQTPEPETPAPTQYTLAVSASEGGTVSTEGGTYDEGTEVTIIATSNEGYRFTGWEGNSSTSESLTVTLNSNQTYQALFELIPIYTLTITSSDGGTVLSEGGDYEEGTEVTITAIPDEGYEFVGWEGSDEIVSELTFSINSDLDLSPIFQRIQSDESLYYSSGDIVPIEPIIFYDRELEVNGVKLIAAGNIGGQEAVPNFWIYKTARVYELLLDKDGEDIDANSQLNMIKTLKGEIGWHQGRQAGQRIARGGGG